jgi:UrcA family protein
MNRITAPCLILVALVASPTFAGADVPSEVVRVADLDLSRDRDVGILYQRLRFAAAAVCPASGREPARAALARACRETVLDRTVDEARVPRLTALHRGKAGAREDRLARR